MEFYLKSRFSTEMNIQMGKKNKYFKNVYVAIAKINKRTKIFCHFVNKFKNGAKF